MASKKKNGRTWYTPKQKLEIVQLAKRIGVENAARKLRVTSSPIRHWMKGERLGTPGMPAQKVTALDAQRYMTEPLLPPTPMKVHPKFCHQCGTAL